VNERDKRLAIIILGVILLIPVAYALIATVIGYLVELFI
jgi:hypothetical protein